VFRRSFRLKDSERQERGLRSRLTGGLASVGTGGGGILTWLGVRLKLPDAVGVTIVSGLQNNLRYILEILCKSFGSNPPG